MGNLKPKDRPLAGYRSEDGTARALKRKGLRVKQAPRNSKGHDMTVNGKKVEVKAAVKTSYKGSDGYPITGYVFSNLKKNPSADKFILKCMSPDRKRIVKTYEIPASQVKQRTLTITENSKYDKFRKQAFLTEQPQPSRRHSEPFRGKQKKPLKKRLRRAGFEMAGATVGALVGAGIPATLELGRAMRGERSETYSTDFKTLLGVSAGAVVGRNLGRMIEQHTGE